MTEKAPENSKLDWKTPGFFSSKRVGTVFNTTDVNSFKSSCSICMLHRYWSLNHTWTIISHGFCFGGRYLANELDIFFSGI